MNKLSNLMLIIICCSLFFFAKEESLNFTGSLQFKDLLKEKEYNFTANYKRTSDYKYLYIFPKNLENKMYQNKAILKIYFKQILDKNSDQDLKLNYLNSDYSTIDSNSGIFIELDELTSDKAIVYIKSFQSTYLRLYYLYKKEISFPSYYKYSNFQLNQFILKKKTTKTIQFTLEHDYNDYLLIISKTSLRNIEITVKYNNNDVTKEKLAYLYPNGCSIYLDRDSLIGNHIDFNITINNNNLEKDEILLLGYVHHINNEIFPDELVNGYQVYLEGNKNELSYLKVSGNSHSSQYFTYQTYSKGIDIDFSTNDNYDKGTYSIQEYNSMFSYDINFEGKMIFLFYQTPKRNALYFQYIDYYEYEIAQKSLQYLVPGVPKSMTIPSKNSMYHFLPKERDSQNLNYFLRAKTHEKIYVSFEACTSYPENCTFIGKRDSSVEIIQNIGLWVTIPRNKKELQLIYVYCENECSYDILMTYEDTDELFLFPDNDYTKFISDSGKDIFALPVFEYFETSKTQFLYIDLTTINGKVELTLQYKKDGNSLNYNSIKIGKKQSYIISKEIFLKDENYYKKEIYAIVEQDKNYKNTIYNIMYGSGDSNTKLLKNNIINSELLTVPETNKISDYTKTFTFIDNQNPLFISISTQLCQSKITIDNSEKNSAYNHFYSLSKGIHNVKIYLIKDENICKEKFEDTAIIFSFNSYGEVLLPENTLINITISSSVTFLHLFKPNQLLDDNSFNLEIERFSENSLSLTYQLKRISFNGNDNKQPYINSSHKINSKKIRYISNTKIKEICGSLNKYEVCSLRMTFNPFSSSKFSLNLSKNALYFAKDLTQKTLISSVNSLSVQYFYIDINENKNNDLELLIKSYGQDLKYNYDVKIVQQDDNVVLPLKKNFCESSNNHQNIIEKSNFSNCNDFCRLYIGVAMEDSKENEISSLFSIAYRYLNEEYSSINLPLNYFTQYTFKDSSEMNYIINPIEDDDFTFELYVIKQNEDDDTEVIADISGSVTYKLSSSEGKYIKSGLAKEIKVKLIKNKGNDKSTFKFRVSSIGNGNLFKGFIPMISSYEEKCYKKPCYFILDDFSLDNEETSAYFYIPEKENSVINIKELKYDDKFTNSGYNKSSNDTMKRPNWYEYSNINKEKDVIIKIEDNDEVTLCSSFYNKPNNVTLNYGEKRMFTLKKKILETIIFNINQPSVQKSKVRINIHSIRGNGIFKFNKEIYPLGLENAYKEDISIIIDDDKLSNIKLTAINEKNGKADTDNEYPSDFVFTIEYKIDLFDQLIYEINYDKINSYKFYRKEKIDKVLFYMNITRPNIDLNMNIKIYSNSTQYDIKSYFVNNNFIQKRLKNSEPDSGLNITGEEIKTYIQGGNSNNGAFTFSKLEISSDKLQNNIKDYPFICIIFTPKGKQNIFSKFDLYPYEMNNTIPLARNQLFIQKIKPNNDIYKLFLSKSDIFYKKEVKIDFVPPLLKKYDYSIAHFDSKISNPKESEDDFIEERIYLFGKEEITLNSLKNTSQKNILFNLFSKDNSEKEDSFIFSYRNQKSTEEKEIYKISEEYFNITGDSNEVKYILEPPVPKNLGHTIIISKVYEFEKIKHLNIDDNNYCISLYLLFSDIKPIFEQYEILSDTHFNGNNKITIKNKLKKGGDLYFTAICILEDNEREIYFTYEGIRKEIDDKNFLDDLLDYMKDHIFATVIILIIIIIILGMIINICRTERKAGRLSSIKVDVEGKLMEDKTD